MTSPGDALERLAGCRRPLLVGVRHHSAVLAAAIPSLLDAFDATAVLVELPVTLEPWLPWLGHPETRAPVALACASSGRGLSFYPFADFSPELAAIRWAVARGVEVRVIDAPAGTTWASHDELFDDEGLDDEGVAAPPSLLERYRARAGAGDDEELWRRQVEARALGAPPEAVRRAALLHGWARRMDDAARPGGVARSDLGRETHMRAALAACRAERPAAVVGAFHAAALLPEPIAWEPVPPASVVDAAGVVTSLIPYRESLLDDRSGYPAGIRDPRWQGWVLEAARDPSRLEAAAARAAVEICADLRARRHVASAPDAREVVRMAVDLARLRGLPAPDRQELLEALWSVLGQGDAGRGQALQAAARRVLTGDRRGRLAPGTPRSGLVPHVEGLLAALGLPGPGEPARELALDPLRGDVDRRRHVALLRLDACGVPYARRLPVAALGEGEALTARWAVEWTEATGAMLELAGTRGVTLEQAASGALRERLRRLESEERLGPDDRLAAARQAVECGLGPLAHELLVALMGPFLAVAGLDHVLAAIDLVERIARGHVPGAPPEGEAGPAEVPGAVGGFALPAAVSLADLVDAAIRALDGLAGSRERAHAGALLALVRLCQRRGHGVLRLGWSLEHLATRGSPLMQGAASAGRLLVGRDTPEGFGARLASWVDLGIDREARAAMRARLEGALTVAGPLLEAEASLLGGLIERVERLDGMPFLRRLPALRGAFDVLARPARARLLDVLLARLGDHAGAIALVDEDPRELARLAEADLAGHHALEALDLAPEDA